MIHMQHIIPTPIKSTQREGRLSRPEVEGESNRPSHFADFEDARALARLDYHPT